jgi:hypothetical protein
MAAMTSQAKQEYLYFLPFITMIILQSRSTAMIWMYFGYVPLIFLKQHRHFLLLSVKRWSNIYFLQETRSATSGITILVYNYQNRCIKQRLNVVIWNSRGLSKYTKSNITVYQSNIYD